MKPIPPLVLTIKLNNLAASHEENYVMTKIPEALDELKPMLARLRHMLNSTLDVFS
jgi:hypothetical protein